MTNIDWLSEETQELDSVTIQQFEELCELAFKINAKIDGIEAELKSENENLRKLKTKMQSLLEKFGKDNYKSNFGSVVVANIESYPTPKTKEEKEALFNYLKNMSEDVYWSKVSVNHQTLQTLCKEEMAQALERGDTTFRVPGIGEPTIMKQVRLRKGK